MNCILAAKVQNIISQQFFTGYHPALIRIGVRSALFFNRLSCCLIIPLDLPEHI